MPQTATVEWITEAVQLSSVVNSANGRELFQWKRQLEAEETTFDDDVQYQLIEGRLPCGLSLDPDTGLIDGTITELDDCVAEFETLATDQYDTEDTSGGNYASKGSAAAGEYTFSFTVRAEAVAHDAHADRTFSILVVNNWSSDRDRFIREYLGEAKLEQLKAAGHLPPLTNA